ncbi:MAG: ABC transporter ATP-binding protein [Dehalococcoidia bacterium]
MKEPLLRCHNVSKHFGRIAAVDRASLDLAEGEMLALLGPSGCGKTTLLRLIAGFEHVDDGEITLRGRTLARPGYSLAPNRRRVGLVFQDFALFPHLSVAANVGFGLPRGATKKARVAQLLDLVGLAGMGKRMPHELSGGQQQRVALARTLAAEPEVILLDEPFSNLDPGLRARVRAEVLRILQDLGTTTIIVTHDQDEALSLPGRVAVMLHGHMRQVGAPGEIYHTPVDREVAEFVGDANFLDGTADGSMASCELGPVPLANDPGARGPVDVMVRPEDLRLGCDYGTETHVIGTEFFGHDMLVTLRLPSGREIKVRQLPGIDLHPGELVRVGVSGRAVAYPRSH